MAFRPAYGVLFALLAPLVPTLVRAADPPKADPPPALRCQVNVRKTPLRELIPDADLQRLAVSCTSDVPTGSGGGAGGQGGVDGAASRGTAGPSATGSESLIPFAGSIELRQVGKRLFARAEAGTYFVFEHIPAELPPGPSEWDIHDGRSTLLGTIQLTVAERPLGIALDGNGKPTLAVRYAGQYIDSNHWHTGKSVEGAAVVTVNNASSSRFVELAPNWSMPSTLQQLTRNWLVPEQPPTQPRCAIPQPGFEDEKLDAVSDDHARAYERCIAGRLHWSVSSKTWDAEATQMHFLGNMWSSGTTVLTDLSQFRFAVMKVKPGPLVLDVALVDGTTGEANTVIWYRESVTVALLARRESLPLPVSSALRIECGNATAQNGETRGVDAAEFDGGACKLVYDPFRLEHGQSAQVQAAQATVERAKRRLWDSRSRRPPGTSGHGHIGQGLAAITAPAQPRGKPRYRAICEGAGKQGSSAAAASPEPSTAKASPKQTVPPILLDSPQELIELEGRARERKAEMELCEDDPKACAPDRPTFEVGASRNVEDEAWTAPPDNKEAACKAALAAVTAIYDQAATAQAALEQAEFDIASTNESLGKAWAELIDAYSTSRPTADLEKKFVDAREQYDRKAEALTRAQQEADYTEHRKAGATAERQAADLECGGKADDPVGKAKRAAYLEACQELAGVQESYGRFTEDELQEARLLWTAERRLQDLFGEFAEELSLAGRQDLIVTVSRTGAQSKSFLWVLDNPTVQNEVALPALDTSNASGPYMIEAKLNGALPPNVVRRPNESATTTAQVVIDPDDLRFLAYLRPRGKGALPNWARVFITIPFDAIAVRFPARPSELPDSTTMTEAQLVAPRMGLAAVLEPWDFNVGRNAWAIPIRFEVGSYLFSTDHGFDPAFFGGAKVALPLLDLPDGVAKDQLNTDVTIGFFVEKPFDYPGAHFLVTTGLDILSIFGTK